MHATIIWPIVVFAIKLVLVGATALMMAFTFWLLYHALRNGAVLERKRGPVRTRTQTPLRFWLYVAWQVLVIVSQAVMIDVIIHLGDPPMLPAAAPQEEPDRSPARPNDEAYDRV